MKKKETQKEKIRRLIKRILHLERDNTDALYRIATLEAQLKATENLRRGESVVNTKLLEELQELRCKYVS